MTKLISTNFCKISKLHNYITEEAAGVSGTISNQLAKKLKARAAIVKWALAVLSPHYNRQIMCPPPPNSLLSFTEVMVVRR